jgi:hypothetical protein
MQPPETGCHECVPPGGWGKDRGRTEEDESDPRERNDAHGMSAARYDRGSIEKQPGAREKRSLSVRI